MKTRTLLLLSVVTGMLILIAGTAQLLRVANQDEADPPSPIGEPVEVGDMTVTVERSTERKGVLAVELAIGGTDDSDGGRDFQVIVPGEVIDPLDEPPEHAEQPDGAGDALDRCAETTESVRRCQLVFDVSGTDSNSRTLRYQRGEEAARWLLGAE